MHKLNTENFLSIHHVSFVISNLQASLQFYQQILGLQLDESRPDLGFDGFWFRINASQQIHLLYVDNVDPLERPEHGGRDRHAAFKVKSTEKVIKQLELHQISYSMSKSGRKALFVRDPDGNTLELME